MRLGGEVHRTVRLVPLSEYAHAFEVGHLLGDLFGGKGAAFSLNFVARQVSAVQFFDGVFNRQTMAIPARDVLRIHALELARLDDHVLQNLVGGMANVQLPVGIRRAIVQDEFGCAVARIAQFFIDAFFVPFLHPARLALGQVAAHGEGRIGQVQGAAIVGFTGSFFNGVGHGKSKES